MSPARKLGRTSGSNTGDKMGRTALTNAVIEGRVEDARRALMSGDDPNAADRAGWTALHFAARDHRMPLVQLLLEHGAKVDAEDAHGNTPLGNAAFEQGPGLADTLKALLAAGADPNRKNKSGVSPSDLARTTRDPTLLALLNAQ